MVTCLICKKQEGEGCDYTIGCGMTYEMVDFDGSFAEAVKHFTQQEAYPDGEEEGFALDDIEQLLIVNASELVIVNLERLKKKHKAKEDADGRKEAEKQERAEFQRLQKKYGRA